VNTTNNSTPVAVVTGAGRRVGEAVARYLSGRNYRVALVALRSMESAQQIAAELAATGPPAIAVAADVSDEDQVRAMVGRVGDSFGRIDGLVNCAAIWNSAPLETTRAADVRAHFEANTLGTFLCCQQVGLAMAEQADGGAIVNIGDWAIARPYLDYAAYFASKGAIGALTRSFAVELAARNPRVRVNAILPGPVLLPEDMPREERERVVAATLVKREGRAEHVAHAAAFLLENEFVTGACLPVDGGRSVYAPSDER
jgi:pteridine reductase